MVASSSPSDAYSQRSRSFLLPRWEQIWFLVEILKSYNCTRILLIAFLLPSDDFSRRCRMSGPRGRKTMFVNMTPIKSSIEVPYWWQRPTVHSQLHDGPSPTPFQFRFSINQGFAFFIFGVKEKTKSQNKVAS